MYANVLTPLPLDLTYTEDIISAAPSILDSPSLVTRSRNVCGTISVYKHTHHILHFKLIPRSVLVIKIEPAWHNQCNLAKKCI